MTNTQLILLAFAALSVAAAGWVRLRASRSDTGKRVEPLPPEPLRPWPPQPEQPEPEETALAEPVADAPSAPAEPTAELVEVIDENDPLQMQIALLADAGLTLAPGITRRHLLSEAGDMDYANAPFGPILGIYCGDVSEGGTMRPICLHATQIALEGITGPGQYSDMVRRIARVGGVPQAVSFAEDDVDPETGTGTLRYRLGEIEQTLEPVCDGDWTDTEVVFTILRDVAGLMSGRSLWTFDNGSCFGLLALSEDGAALLDELAPGMLEATQ